MDYSCSWQSMSRSRKHQRTLQVGHNNAKFKIETWVQFKSSGEYRAIRPLTDYSLTSVCTHWSVVCFCFILQDHMMDVTPLNLDSAIMLHHRKFARDIIIRFCNGKSLGWTGHSGSIYHIPAGVTKKCNKQGCKVTKPRSTYISVKITRLF